MNDKIYNKEQAEKIVQELKEVAEQMAKGEIKAIGNARKLLVYKQIHLFVPYISKAVTAALFILKNILDHIYINLYSDNKNEYELSNISEYRDAISKLGQFLIIILENRHGNKEEGFNYLIESISYYLSTLNYLENKYALPFREEES